MKIFPARFKTAILALILGLSLSISGAGAEIVIEVTKGADNPYRIAVVPIEWQLATSPQIDIAGVVARDLGRFGEFRVLARNLMLSLPSSPDQVFYADWKRVGVDYLLIGQAKEDDNSAKVKVDYWLYDVLAQNLIVGSSVSGGRGDLTRLAHFISDKVYQALVNLPGLFSTKIVYVNYEAGRRQPYVLKMSDMDGGRDVDVFRSSEPILSPDWSPDGRQVAYVSFENFNSNVILQDLATGERRTIASFKGINSSPSWSPDGKRLLTTLSFGENPDIYLIDIATGKWSRLTDHPGIDTEASWSEDGKKILFTSDRAGRPHLFTMELATRKITQVTKAGSYNARGRFLPDGERIVLIRQGSDQGFRVAIFNTKNDLFTDISTGTALDESPCISPNGNVVLYATQLGNQKVLAGVAVNSKAQFILPAGDSEIREPDWSPFFR